MKSLVLYIVCFVCFPLFIFVAALYLYIRYQQQIYTRYVFVCRNLYHRGNQQFAMKFFIDDGWKDLLTIVKQMDRTPKVETLVFHSVCGWNHVIYVFNTATSGRDKLLTYSWLTQWKWNYFHISSVIVRILNLFFNFCTRWST